MGTLNVYLESLRPRQWTKNLLLMASVIFAQLLGCTPCVLRAVAAVGVFCLASGVIYIFNDIADRALDRAARQARYPGRTHLPDRAQVDLAGRSPGGGVQVPAGERQRRVLAGR